LSKKKLLIPASVALHIGGLIENPSQTGQNLKFGPLRAVKIVSMSSCTAPSMPLDTQADRLLAVKQFVRNVRASKTIADERAVVQKESAAIRASFREESGDSNVR
jgi:hypothetical protein